MWLQYVNSESVWIESGFGVIGVWVHVRVRLVRINDIDMENTVDRGLGYYSSCVLL